jgi:hypothetical protein
VALQALSDSSTTPTTALGVAQETIAASGQWVQFATFSVLPGNYYRVADISSGTSCSGTGAAGDIWIEWH